MAGDAKAAALAAQPDDAIVELPEEYGWFEGGQSYVVCAFYTPNYLPQVTNLKRSLEAHGVNHYLKRYERASTWEATTRLKAVFVRHCLNALEGKDILYTDADSVMRQEPKFVESIKSDLGLLFHPKKSSRHPTLRISLGTFFIRNTPGGHRFAELWTSQESKAGLLTADDDMIINVFDELVGVSMTVLPPNYYKIFDKPGIEPIFEHFQASRGQFKWRRVHKKTKKWLMRIAAIAAIGLGIYYVRAWGT